MALSGGAADSRRAAVLAHLMESLTGGVEVKPGSIPELETGDITVRPRVPAVLVAEALSAVPPERVVRPGLRLDSLEIVGDLDLSFLDFAEELQFTNCVFTGGLDLSQARLAALRLHKSTLVSADGVYAVNAPQLAISDSLVLPAEVNRPINLTAANIGENLAGCPSLTGEVGGSWTLDALGIEVGGVISIGLPQFRWGGAINLCGAVVAGGVRIAGLLEQPAEGSALDMSWAEVGEDVDLSLRIENATSPDDLVIQIAHARIKRNLTVRLALADGGIDATDTTVDGCFRTDQEDLVPGGALLISGLDAGDIDFGAQATDLPRLRQLTRLKAEDISGRLGVHAKSARDWLDGAGAFATQPWEEFAKVYAANGQPANARSMRYWAARRATKQSPVPTRLVRNLYWVTTGHGYYPLLALVWLVVLFAGALALTNLHHDRFTTPVTSAIARATTAPLPASVSHKAEPATEPPKGRIAAKGCANPQWDTPCLNDVEYSISLTLSPVTSTLPWQPPPGWATSALLAIRALSWVFVALLLAGVTGLLRRE